MSPPAAVHFKHLPHQINLFGVVGEAKLWEGDDLGVEHGDATLTKLLI